jgi:hypothetical protein
VRWLVAASMVGLIVVALSPYVKQHRWPFSFSATDSGSVVTHDPSSAGDIAKTTAPIRSQLDDVTRQRNVARQELEDTKRQLDPVRLAVPHTPERGNQEPITWNPEFMLVALGAGPNALITAIIFRGISSSTVQMKDAYVISELAGHKQQLAANIPYGGGVVLLDHIEPVPPGATLDSIIEWKPGLSIGDFLDQWGRMHFTAAYDNTTYEKLFDGDSIRQKIIREIQDAGGPRVTKRRVGQ